MSQIEVMVMKLCTIKTYYSRKFGVNADDAPYEWSKKVKVVLSDLDAE